MVQNGFLRIRPTFFSAEPTFEPFFLLFALAGGFFSSCVAAGVGEGAAGVGSIEGVGLAITVASVAGAVL